MNSVLMSLAWQHFWQLSLTAGLIMIIVRGIARQRPHLAHALLLAVLIKAIVPPFIASPVGVFCWSPAWTPGGSSSPAKTGPESPSQDVPNNRSGIETAGTPIPGVRTIVVTAPRDVPAQVTRNSEAGVPTIVVLASGLLVFWMLGFGVVGALALIRWRRAHREIHAATIPTTKADQEHVKSLARRLGIRRQIQLVITQSNVGPAIIGVFRPVIVLPEIVLKGRTLQDLDPILAHELLHYRRGDQYTGVLQLLVMACWWFHPLVWKLCQRITREAERCCDEQVIAEIGCRPQAYAKSLLDILDMKSKLAPVPIFPGVKPMEITTQRLERIMSLRQGCRKRSPWWCWTALAIGLILFVPGAMLMPADGKEKKSKPIPRKLKPRARGQLLLRSYEVADLVGFAQESRDRLLNELKNALDKRSGTARRKTELRWADKTTIIALQSVEDHQLIKELLDRAVRRARQQFLIQATLVTGSPREIQRLHDHCQIFQKGHELGKDEEVNDEPRAVPDLSFLFADEPQTPDSQAALVVRRSQQLTQFLLKGDRADQLKFRIGNSAACDCLCAPHVAVCNGQLASIFVGSELALPREAKDGNTKVEFIEDGIRIDLRALMLKDDKIHLDYDLKLTSILGHPADNDKGGPELPVVETSQLTGSVTMAPETMLFLFGPTRRERGKDQRILLMLSASELQPHKLTAEQVSEDIGLKQLQPPTPGRYELVPKTGIDMVDFVADLAKEKSAEAGAAGQAEIVRWRMEAPQDDEGEPPSDDDIMQMLSDNPTEPEGGGISVLHEVSIDNVRIVKEKIADYVDPPKDGMQIYHRHYKCTIYYTKHTRSLWPLSSETKDDVVEVRYIDYVQSRPLESGR